jgi:hypothetical protein
MSALQISLNRSPLQAVSQWGMVGRKPNTNTKRNTEPRRNSKSSRNTQSQFGFSHRRRWALNNQFNREKLVWL